jgi:hypothetical protein
MKKLWLPRCSSARMLLSSASMMRAGGTTTLSETDEDARATAWTIIWLTLLAVLGILCAIALALCVLMYVVFSCIILAGQNPSDERQNAEEEKLPEQVLFTEAQYRRPAPQ